jgi:outer membrane protein assembly factor BamB
LGLRGSEKEKARIAKLEKKQKQTIEVVKIYSQENLYSKEIIPTKNAILTKPKNNSSWKMPGLNLQNFLGNMYLSGINYNFLKKKIGKDKFSISKLMSVPLAFEDKLIITDDKGTIFNISQKGKVNWKKNIYKKIYKKIYKNLSLTIHKDTIFIVDNIGFIYAINLDNGKLIWFKNHGVPFKSNLKIFDEKIFKFDLKGTP